MTVRLEELLAAATPGPWESRVWGTERDHWPDRRVSVGTSTGHGAAVCINPRYGELDQSKADADLIALAPDAVRLLIDMGETLALFQYGNPELEALLARLDRLGT